MNDVQKESSIIYPYVEKIKEHYTLAPTLLLGIVLVISLIILKKFIYIKDDKRDHQ